MHTKLLCRRREAADILGFSQAQILKFQRAGLLRPVAVPGLRSVRYDMAEVQSLAQRWINSPNRKRAPKTARGRQPSLPDGAAATFTSRTGGATYGQTTPKSSTP
jgi:hypothetical protein